MAPNPLPARDHDVAILVVDDYGDPFGTVTTSATSGLDCLLLHTLDPSGSPSQGQATRSIGMATRSIGMIGDEKSINVPHGQFVFTQFVDFADPSAYDGLDLEDWVLDAFLEYNATSDTYEFSRYTYPTSHTLSGQMPTNPNGIEFTGYDLIPLHADGDNADNLDENLVNAITRTIALGYSEVVVNMSFRLLRLR